MFLSCLVFGEASIILPDGWTLPVGMQNTMLLYARVIGLDDEYVEAVGTTLAVFDKEGVCRGYAQIEEGPGFQWFQVVVSSNVSMEKGLILKILNAADGEIHDIKESIDFVTESTFPAENYTTAPMILHVKPLTHELSIPLVQNWNWISFNVQQGDRTLLEFLEDYTQNATNGDIIKTQNGQATYSGGKWYPSPASFRLEPGKMYKLRKQKAGNCTLTVNGMPCDGSEPINVVVGWNWIGYTGEGQATIGAFYKEGGFADNDLIKPQSGSQATYSGGKWYGNLIFKPGAGYMLKQVAGGMVDYRYEEENRAR